MKPHRELESDRSGESDGEVMGKEEGGGRVEGWGGCTYTV